MIRTIFWDNEAIVLIDQNKLPLVETYLTCRDYQQVITAINDLTIRGAPAIGVAAAMGIALGVNNCFEVSSDRLKEIFDQSIGESECMGGTWLPMVTVF
jgi:methylthioribose-1-phosphate isomerase